VTIRYEIRDASGRLVAYYVRRDTGDGKQIWWEQPDGSTGLNGTCLEELPLYGADLVSDAGADELIVVCEGEKARDALEGVKIPAVGTVTGAAGTPGPEALEVLRDRRVCLWPDNDDAGRAHMERIGQRLRGVAAEVRIFTWYDAEEAGADAADHHAVKSGHAEAIDRLFTDLEDSPLFEPEPEAEPGTFTAADLMAQELPEPSWIVPDILAEGVAILAGKPKLGKSWMALGLCVAVASGGYALGTKSVEQGGALYLALEDNRRRLQNRLRQTLPDGNPPADLHMALGWPRMDEGGAEKLDDWLSEHPDARIVCIDTLKRFAREAAETGRSTNSITKPWNL
jgi:hypothetical protein